MNISDDKIMYVCIALAFIASCFCLAQCVPLVDQGHTDRITACSAAGGSYIEGKCLQMCGGE